MAQHRPEIDRWILDAIGTEAETLLDLGCGVGRNAFLLWERGSPTRCVGHEIDEGFLDRARRLGLYERLERRDLADGVHEPDDSFQVVVCTDVIGLLDRPDAERLLDECERVASERVVVSVDVAPGLQRRSNPNEHDRSDWKPGDLRARGYEVRGFGSRLSHERDGGRRFLFGFHGGMLLAHFTDRFAEGVFAVKHVN